MVTTPDGRRLLTLSEARDRLQISESTLHRRLKLPKEDPKFLSTVEYAGRRYIAEAALMIGELSIVAQSCAVISFANQKGGVGKTTLAVNTAGILASRGFRVLLIDMDPQANASGNFLNWGDLPQRPSLINVLVEQVPPENVIVKAVRPNLDLLPANIRLSGLESSQQNVGAIFSLRNKIVTALKPQYDFILIDSPPSLGRILTAVLVAGRYVVIPLEPDLYSMQGLTDLLQSVRDAREVNPELGIVGAVLNRMQSGTQASQGYPVLLRDFFDPTGIFDSTLTNRASWEKAKRMGRLLHEYEQKDGKPALEELHAFVSELIERIGAGTE